MGWGPSKLHMAIAVLRQELTTHERPHKIGPTNIPSREGRRTCKSVPKETCSSLRT